jgi:Zn-finger nucleic acid-binding protein
MSTKKEFYGRAIDCPKCGSRTKRIEVEIFGPNIFIDICPKCRGHWLDHGELNKLLKDKKLSDYLTKEIGTASKSKLICPRCGGLMDVETAEDVAVDVCLSCNGVWLDAGELEELKEISKSGFEGDEVEKASERYEEYMVKNRTSKLNRFFKRLGL